MKKRLCSMFAAGLSISAFAVGKGTDSKGEYWEDASGVKHYYLFQVAGSGNRWSFGYNTYSREAARNSQSTTVAWVAGSIYTLEREATYSLRIAEHPDATMYGIELETLNGTSAPHAFIFERPRCITIGEYGIHSVAGNSLLLYYAGTGEMLHLAASQTWSGPAAESLSSAPFVIVPNYAYNSAYHGHVGAADDVVLTIPKRITAVSGIAKNLERIDAIRVCAIGQIDALQANGQITSADASRRKRIINNAFGDYAFPWMTLEKQLYWKNENAEGGAKDFKTGQVYYGVPYISGSGDNREYNVEKLLKKGIYYDSGKGYYILDQKKINGRNYYGNDCSCFVDAAIWGTGSTHSWDRTTEIAKSSAYRTVSFSSKRIFSSARYCRVCSSSLAKGIGAVVCSASMFPRR